MRPFALSLALCLALASLSEGARAGEPLVLLDLERCDELDETEVRRMVAAELGALPTNAGGDGVTHVVISCDGSRVVVRVEDPLSRKGVQRRFNLGPLDPRARGRLVSIAATELVLASWAELQTNPNPQVEPEGTAPDPDTRRAAERVVKQHELAARYAPTTRKWHELETPTERPLRVMALVSARGFFSYPGTLYGGGARIGEERFRWLSWAGDLLLEQGDVDSGPRKFSLLTFTAAGWLLGYLRSGAFTARLGPGLSLGMAQSTEQAGGESTPALAPWGWPLAAASISLAARSFVIEVSGEGGYAVLPLGGGGDPAVLRDGWFSAQVGLGFNLAGASQGP